MNALNNSAARLEIVYQSPCLVAVFISNDYLSLAALRSSELCILIYVAVGMTGNRYRLCPARYKGSDALYDDRSAKYRAVKYRSYRAVWGLPHLLELVLFNSCGVWGDGRAFYRDSVFLGRVRTVYGNLVVGLVAVLKSEVVVFGLEINIGQYKLVLYHFPDDPCHLVAVHLYDGGSHFDFVHISHFLFGCKELIKVCRVNLAAFSALL